MFGFVFISLFILVYLFIVECYFLEVVKGRHWKFVPFCLLLSFVLSLCLFWFMCLSIVELIEGEDLFVLFIAEYYFLEGVKRRHRKFVPFCLLLCFVFVLSLFILIYLFIIWYHFLEGVKRRHRGFVPLCLLLCVFFLFYFISFSFICLFILIRLFICGWKWLSCGRIVCEFCLCWCLCFVPVFCVGLCRFPSDINTTNITVITYEY